MTKQSLPLSSALMIANWLVELHGSLRCGFSSCIDRELDKIYHDTFYGENVRSWMNEDVQVFMLGKENEVFYVFVHFLNHFYKSGVGIRQICDWCRLLWTFRDSLDINALEARLKRMKLMSEWRVFGMFAVEYLGMPKEAMPFYCEDKKWKSKAKQILAFAIFIHLDPRIDRHHIINEVKISERHSSLNAVA